MKLYTIILEFLLLFRARLFENLRLIPHAPSVQMQCKRISFPCLTPPTFPHLCPPLSPPCLPLPLFPAFPSLSSLPPPLLSSLPSPLSPLLSSLPPPLLPTSPSLPSPLLPCLPLPPSHTAIPEDAIPESEPTEDDLDERISRKLPVFHSFLFPHVSL